MGNSMNAIQSEIERITGAPFIPTPQQKLTPARGHSAADIVGTLQAQFDRVKAIVAAGASLAVYGDQTGYARAMRVIQPHMFVSLIETTRKFGGIRDPGKSIYFNRLSGRDAATIVYAMAMEEAAECHWLFRNFRDVDDRLPREGGINYWTHRIMEGAEDRTYAEQAQHNDRLRREQLAHIKEQVARNG